MKCVLRNILLFLILIVAAVVFSAKVYGDSAILSHSQMASEKSFKTFDRVYSTGNTGNHSVHNGHYNSDGLETSVAQVSSCNTGHNVHPKLVSGPEKAVYAYLRAKIKKAKQSNGKPCIVSVRLFLARHTTWQILSKKCTTDSCIMEIVFKEPVLEPVLKRFTKEAVMKAIREKGMSGLDNRACEIMAKKIKRISLKNMQYRKFRRNLQVRYINGNWITVDPHN